jgi:hypothetical protein
MTTLEPNTSALVVLARQASGMEDHSDNDVRSWHFPTPALAHEAMKAAIDAIGEVWKQMVEKSQ